MTAAADVILIGGGAIGMLLARELAGAGARVLIVERGHCGQEASWAGGGIISPLYPWRYPEAVSRLANWSQDAYPDLIAGLEEDTGMAVEYSRNGLLLLRIDDEARAFAWARQQGRRLDRVTVDEMADLQPGLQAEQPGLWMPTVASVRNPRLTAALRQWCLHSGQVTVLEDTAVHALTGNGACWQVQTDRQRLAADQVVVCAGAWSSQLLAGHDVDLQVEPVLGQMLLYAPAPGLLSRIVLQEGRYLIPRADGRILCGSTREYTGFSKRLTGAANRELQQAATAMLPALADVELEAQWCGLRPGSPDGVPLMSNIPGAKGLFVCSGHFRNGLVLAPASARLTADLVLGRVPLLDPEPYSVP